MKKLRNFKKSLLSLIILIVLSFIGYGVSDGRHEEPIYDESAFEEDVYEIEGDELAMLEGESFSDDEMSALSDAEIQELLEEAEEIDDLSEEEANDPAAEMIAQDGSYTSKEEVAEYIDTYGELPSNYITKSEARKLGWDSEAGNLDEVAPGKSIGGDKFGNYEGMLPEEDGRQYYECDIDFDGGYRNSKRIVYSNDGLIFYTDDHYETFVQLY